jgi:DnaK suppressor protein
MATTEQAKGGATTPNQELTRILGNRRHELMSDIQGRIRDVRADSNKERGVLDSGEDLEVGSQDEIAFALIQMKSETLTRIDTALRHLENGSYGDCVECGDEISMARLRAVPFASRCRGCEDARESAEHRERKSRRHWSSALSFDTTS